VDRNRIISARFRFGPGNDVPIGEIALDRNAAVFEYDPGFAASGLSLNPTIPAGQPGLIRPRNPEAFYGLHGVFADSLPDAWGELLLERRLRASNRSYADLTVLDRLAEVGEDGRGAIVYLPAREHEEVQHELDLDALAGEANALFGGAASDVVRELEILGESSGGARPKIQIWLNDAGRAYAGHAAPNEPGFTAWIVKFAASVDRFADIGPLEAAYADAARAAGITMPRTRLLPSQTGPGYFATERFDRGPSGARIHMLSIAGMLDADWRYASIDYDTLLESIRGATRDEHAVEQGFRRMVFNVAAINRDDHAKQHSLLYAPREGWRLSPAYDLTFSSGPGAEHYLAVNGKGRDITHGDLVTVAERQSIDARRAASVIAEVEAAVSTLPRVARKYGASVATVSEIERAIGSQRAIAASESRPRRRPRGSR
jgi:serine/threonine-protein kinase HipA